MSTRAQAALLRPGARRRDPTPRHAHPRRQHARHPWRLGVAWGTQSLNIRDVDVDRGAIRVEVPPGLPPSSNLTVYHELSPSLSPARVVSSPRAVAYAPPTIYAVRVANALVTSKETAAWRLVVVVEGSSFGAEQHGGSLSYGDVPIPDADVLASVASLVEAELAGMTEVAAVSSTLNIPFACT